MRMELAYWNWTLALPMAVATLASSHQVPCFRDSSSRTRAEPWQPSRGTLLKLRKRARFSSVVTGSSSTSQPREANAETAESCVNTGLQLFSKGRVRRLCYAILALFFSDPNSGYYRFPWWVLEVFNYLFARIITWKDFACVGCMN